MVLILIICVANLNQDLRLGPRAIEQPNYRNSSSTVFNLFSTEKLFWNGMGWNDFSTWHTANSFFFRCGSDRLKTEKFLYVHNSMFKISGSLAYSFQDIIRRQASALGGRTNLVQKSLTLFL